MVHLGCGGHPLTLVRDRVPTRALSGVPDPHTPRVPFARPAARRRGVHAVFLRWGPCTVLSEYRVNSVSPVQLRCTDRRFLDELTTVTHAAATIILDHPIKTCMGMPPALHRNRSRSRIPHARNRPGAQGRRMAGTYP